MSIAFAVRSRQGDIGGVPALDLLGVRGQNIAHHHLTAVRAGRKAKDFAVGGDGAALRGDDLAYIANLIGQNLNRLVPVCFDLHENIIFINLIALRYKHVGHGARCVGVNRVGAVRAGHNAGGRHSHGDSSNERPDKRYNHDQRCSRQSQPGHGRRYFQHGVQLIGGRDPLQR